MISQDIKPENFLIREPSCDGDIPQLKLTDFGIAREIPGKIDYYYMTTVFVRISAAALINFSASHMRRLIEGGVYSRAALI